MANHQSLASLQNELKLMRMQQFQTPQNFQGFSQPDNNGLTYNNPMSQEFINNNTTEVSPYGGLSPMQKNFSLGLQGFNALMGYQGMQTAKDQADKQYSLAKTNLYNSGTLANAGRFNSKDVGLTLASQSLNPMQKQQEMQRLEQGNVRTTIQN